MIKESTEGEMKGRHFVFHATWLAATFLSLFVLLSEPRAGEEEVVVLSGKLNGYDAISVVVDGEHIDLCEDARVLDPTEKPILTDGLVATETVEVMIVNGCATEVQAMEIRR
jgi:hypothetical protein